MVRVIYNVIKDLVPHISQEQINLFYLKIQTVPPKQFDEKFLTFLKDFTLKALENQYEAKKDEMSTSEEQAVDYDQFCDNKEMAIVQKFNENINDPNKGLIGSEMLYGLPIFWDLIQDKMSNMVSNEMMDQALQSITEILKTLPSKHIRMSYVIRCVENLMKSESIVQSIIVSQAIISEYPEFNYNQTVVTHLELIQQLESQVQIIEILIHNISKYYQIVKEKLKTMTDKKNKSPSTTTTQPTQEDYTSHVFLGRHNHQFTINKFLDYLEFLIIGSGNKVQFGIKNIEIMWRLFVQSPNFIQDQNTYLKWINKHREVSYNKQELFLFTEAEKKFFFTQILCNSTYLDYKTISIGQVKSFHKYFILINRQENVINLSRNGKTLRVVDFECLKQNGLETLWNITIESENDKVKEESMDLLVDLYLKFDQTVSVDIQKQIWEEFVEKCMQIIENSGQEQSIQSALQCLSKFIDRYDGKKPIKPELKISSQFSSIQPLTITVFNKTEQIRKQVNVTYFQSIGYLRQKIAEAFDCQINEFLMSIKNTYIDPDVDDDNYIKDFGAIQQILIQQNAAYIPENHPKNLISNNQAYFDKLFSILSQQQSTLIEPTWDLLMKLPINGKLQQELKDLTLVQQDSNNWQIILDPKSTLKLLYTLKILIALNNNKKDQKTIIWRNNFVKLGGFYHLLNTFLQLDVKKIETSLTLKCIDHLINLLFDFFHQDKNILGEVLKHKETFIHKCINLIDLISDYSIKQELGRGETFEDIQKRCHQSKLKKNKYKSYMTGNKGGDKKQQNQNVQGNNNDDDEDNENQDSQQIQNLFKQFQEESQLVSTIFRFLYSFILNNDPHAVVIIPAYPNIEEMLLKSILRTENFCLRQEMAKKIKDMICLKSGTVEMKELQKILEILLLRIEPKSSQVVESRTSQLYEGLASIIENLTPNDLAPLQAPIQKLIYTLANEILNREIKEKSTQDTDYLLMGKMKLAKSLLQKFPLLKTPIGQILTQYLLHNCLFEIPNGGGSSKQQSIGQGGAPKCKSAVLRQNCVRLLAVLCRDCIPNLNLVLTYLNAFNDCPSWRTNKEHDWNISLRESEKSSTGYVGIKNLGCICYMNSLFQQLFMLPTLRNDILSVKNNNPNNEEKEENMLYQLQLLFTGLLKSEKQYVNPKGFCHAFKDWEGNPTNVLEQMDVEEFFNMFMDRLETAIKGNPQDKTVQYHFGGKYTHEMICKGCPHTYERQEPFLALAVQVKNKKSILEGLDTFILGDTLEGENAYLCEKCDKKVDTLKRTSIKKLPRYLIIALKRFEFDFDRMVRVKVNDYCEFPIELNMEPYTQEGLARKEKAQKKEGGEDQAQAVPEEILGQLKHPQDYYMYNLSGIVVHTGTADSGHYYSFIKDKDRPESGKWYEMNDSIVRDFDPNDIPSECFGGEDTFQGYNMQQMKSMKWRNAYLLFYERKTQEDILDEDEEEQKKQMAPQQMSQQMDVVMQGSTNEMSEIESKIAYENQKYWQNRFLFGNEYHELVYDIALNWNTSCLIPKMFLNKNDDFHLLNVPVPQEYLNDMNLPNLSDISLHLSKIVPPLELLACEFNVFKFAVGFYIGILQRSANRTILPQTLSLLKSYINKSPQNAKWFLEEFCNEQLIEENLQQNPQKEMRKFITGLLYCAMLKVYPEEKDRLNLYWKQPNNPERFTILGNLILIFIKNIYELKKFVSHNLQYFQVIARFSSLGQEAREFLLRARIIGRLMDYFFDEVSPYKDEFRTMNDIIPRLKDKPDIGLPTQLDRKQMSYFQEIMERRRLKNMMDAPPKYKYMFEIISNCIRGTQIGILRSPYQLDDLVFQIQSSERDIFIPESKFLKRVFSFAQRTRSVNYICQGYCHYTWNDQEHWAELLKVVIQGLNDHDYEDLKPYLLLFQFMVAKPAPCHQNALDLLLQNLIETIKNNAQFFKFMEVCLEFVFKITGRYEHVRQWFYAKKNQWEWMVEWIKEYKLPPNPMAQNSAIRLFKKRGNANYIQMQNQNFKNDQVRQTALYHYRERRMQFLLAGQCQDTSNELDIDLIDMQDHKFVIGEQVDQYYKKHEKIQNLNVEQVLDEMIYARHVQVGGIEQNPYITWVSCDTDKLMPNGAIQNQIRIEQRKGGSGEAYGGNQHSDDDEEHSDEEDSRIQ